VSGCFRVWMMTTDDALLVAYNAQRPWVPADPPPWLSYEQRGSVLRVLGQHRGFIDTSRDVGAQGESLDSLISEQRDFFARRGEALEWKTPGPRRAAGSAGEAAGRRACARRAGDGGDRPRRADGR
jgi:hypothetical protein